MPLDPGFSVLSHKIHWPLGIALPNTIQKLVCRETLVHPFPSGPSSSWEGGHASLSTWSFCTPRHRTQMMSKTGQAPFHKSSSSSLGEGDTKQVIAGQWVKDHISGKWEHYGNPSYGTWSLLDGRVAKESFWRDIRYERKHKLSPQVCKVVAESLVGYLSGLTTPWFIQWIFNEWLLCPPHPPLC